MKIATEPMFLERISPGTRKILVAERLNALRGRLSEVLTRLRDLVNKTPENVVDKVALCFLWAELLYLDCREDEAITVFKEFIEPNQQMLPIAAQLVASDNLSQLQMASFTPDGFTAFYHLVDRKRAVQIEWSDSADLIEAQRAIEDEKFNEALAPLWRNIVRAYSLGSWRAVQWAAERYGKLCLKYGALEEACHFLVSAQAEKGVEPLADMLFFRQDINLIHAILQRIITYSNLKRHFIVSCKLLAKISDLIPDADLPSIAEWLFPRCQELPVRIGGGVMSAAWEVLRGFGSRLSNEKSKQIIAVALSHPVWLAPVPGENQVLPDRKCMIEAVTFLAHSVSSDFIPEIVDATLPLATDRMQDCNVSPEVAQVVS